MVRPSATFDRAHAWPDANTASGLSPTGVRVSEETALSDMSPTGKICRDAPEGMAVVELSALWTEMFGALSLSCHGFRHVGFLLSSGFPESYKFRRRTVVSSPILDTTVQKAHRFDWECHLRSELLDCNKNFRGVPRVGSKLPNGPSEADPLS